MVIHSPWSVCPGLFSKASNMHTKQCQLGWSFQGVKHLLIKIRQKINFTCPQVAISHFLWFLSPCDSTFFMISQSSSQRHNTVMRLCLNFDILNQKRHRVNHKQVQVQTLLLRLPKETSEFAFWFTFFFYISTDCF